jgi:hypothetical protein
MITIERVATLRFSKGSASLHVSRHQDEHVLHPIDERSPVRKCSPVLTVLWLGATAALASATDASASVRVEQQTAPSSSSRDESSPAPAPEPKSAPAARKKASLRAAIAKKKADRSRATRKKLDRDTGLVMAPGVVCKSIDGFEDYVPLPGAAQTSDEKLLVYLRADGFQTEKVDQGVEGHLTADGEVRRHGEKALLRQKKKMLDYKPKAANYPQLVFLKAAISLKGLSPGEYDLTITLHDEIAKGTSASQVIKFKVIPPKDPRKDAEARAPHEPDGL